MARAITIISPSLVALSSVHTSCTLRQRLRPALPLAINPSHSESRSCLGIWADAVLRNHPSASKVCTVSFSNVRSRIDEGLRLWLRRRRAVAPHWLQGSGLSRAVDRGATKSRPRNWMRSRHGLVMDSKPELCTAVSMTVGVVHVRYAKPSLVALTRFFRSCSLLNHVEVAP